jgi:hypothetical protein
MPKAKTGRPPGRPKKPEKLRSPFQKMRKRYHVQTVPLVAKALIDTGGNLSHIARLFGISRQAVDKFIRDNSAELGPVLLEAREVFIDEGVVGLRDAVWAGEPWAIKLLLTTLGKSRGFAIGHTIGDPNGNPLPMGQTVIILPDNGRNPNLSAERLTDKEVSDLPAAEPMPAVRIDLPQQLTEDANPTDNGIRCHSGRSDYPAARG